METNREKFTKCLEEIDMEDDMKKDTIKAMETMSCDENILDSWDYELDEICLRNGYITEAKEDARKEGLAEGLAEGRAKGRAEGRAEGLDEGRTEGRIQGRNEGRNEEKMEIAKKMLDKKMKFEEIMELTGLSITEINNLIN